MSRGQRAVRVFVVEDSAVTRRLLISVIESADGFEVVGSTANGIDAVEQVAALQPDVVTMDIHLPGLDGLEATRRIMARSATRVLVVSGSSNVTERTLFDVLDVGALGLARRPLPPGRPGAAERRDGLLRELRTIARVSLSAIGRRQPRSGRAAMPERAPAGVPDRLLARNRIEVIGIAASTGGPSAVRSVLAELPPHAPPVLVVQHMSPGFLANFAAWLTGVAPGRVSIAVDGEPVELGMVLLAPDDRHLVVDGERRARLLETPSVNGHRPSGDVLLGSLADTYGEAALGVVLTGMGRDAADGLVRVRAAGGVTLAQDRQSSVVYGMPAAAAELGAAEHVLPLDSIGPTIRQLLASSRHVLKTATSTGEGR